MKPRKRGTLPPKKSGGKKKHEILELISMIMVSITAVLTALLSFASMGYGGLQQEKTIEGNQLATKATDEYTMSTARLTGHQTMWNTFLEYYWKCYECYYKGDYFGAMNSADFAIKMLRANDDFFTTELYRRTNLLDVVNKRYEVDASSVPDNFRNAPGYTLEAYQNYRAIIKWWNSATNERQHFPFSDNNYIKTYYKYPEEVLKQSEEAFKQAGELNHKNDIIQFNVVLMAFTTMFWEFLGKFKKQGLNIAMLCLASATFIGAFVYLFTNINIAEMFDIMAKTIT